MTVKYVCGVDFQHEMEEVRGFNDFYDSLPELKAAKPCWEQCGIVELAIDETGDVVAHSWIVRQDLFRRGPKPSGESGPQS